MDDIRVTTTNITEDSASILIDQLTVKDPDVIQFAINKLFS